MLDQEQGYVTISFITIIFDLLYFFYWFLKDNPVQSNVLGIFGLSVSTTEQQINQIFSKYGPLERVNIVLDSKTGRSRGFCFVYFASSEDAKVAKNQCSGMEIDERKIRVDYSITLRAHTPTPGKYMGRTTRGDRGFENNGYRHQRERGDEYVLRPTYDMFYFI